MTTFRLKLSQFCVFKFWVILRYFKRGQLLSSQHLAVVIITPAPIQSNTVSSITGMQGYNNVFRFPLLTDCGAAEDEMVTVSCSGSHHLSVSWPTNITYTADVVNVPADLTVKLRQRIVKLQKQVHIFQLVILNRQPP